jgi:hypothetical protein
VESDDPEQPGPNRAGRYDFIALADCRSEKILRLCAYWDSQRRGRPMPRRSDIDPTEIWPLLANVFVCEWHTDPDRLFYRIAGTELVAALGLEIRGKWLTDLYPEKADIDRTLALYRRAAESGRPLIGRTIGTQKRIGADTFEWVICPLSEDGARVTHFIGVEDYVASRRYLGGLT